MKGIQESQLSLFKSVSSVTSTNLLPIGMRQIDTPNDHNCLFWSAALGLLIPLLGENEADKARFNAMYSRLFGISGAITLKGKDDKDDAVLDIGTELTRENIRLALKTYDFSKEDPLRFIGNPLYHLIAEVFRRKVVEELPKVFSTSEQRTNIAIAESCSDWEGYLTKMVLPESWGGHPEIEAIAHLANVNITVYGSGMGYPRQYLIMGAVYTLCLAYVNAAGKGSTVKNHYHYGVPETIYETHLKKDTPSIRTDPDEKKKMVFISQHVPLQPMIPQLTGSPFGSQSSLVSLLKSSYEKRAEIRSLGFTDHALPISDVHFTIDQISEEQERECLKAQKDSKAGDSKSDRKPELRVVPVSAAAPQPVLVADIFSPLPQQGKTKEEKKETTDSKISATALSTKPIHRVLILGQAGSGKTTLSKYIAHQWVNGQLWHKRYHNVFWLTLRDLYSLSKKELEECVSSPLPLATLIHRLCLDEATRAKIGIKAIHCMLSDAPEKTLLLIDGFDEVAQIFSPEDKRARQQKALLETTLQSPCDTILTSRGYSLPPKDSFHYDLRLVNQGFTDQQVQRYIEQYFSSLPKPDEKLAKTIQQLVQQNQRFQSLVHNPLILALACDFYRDAYENGSTNLQQLQLLDLYDHHFSTFIRRYLDAQSKYLKKTTLAWETTKELSLNDLWASCPVEVEFLQTLSFMGIEQGLQRFDQSIKEKALEEMSKKHPKTSKTPFLNALKLGFLHQFPGPQASSMHKVHEFVHLTFQEYLAARHIATGLQRHQKSAYDWLRTHKYNPAYREVLNFICAIMKPKIYPVFWKVLLEEQMDLTGTGHLHLLFYSLQAANSAMQDIPNLQNHLMHIEDSLLSEVDKGISNKKVFSWLQTSLSQCPQITGALSDDFWNKLFALLKHEQWEIVELAFELYEFLIYHLSQLSISRRKQLFTRLFHDASDKECQRLKAADRALNSYVQQWVHCSSAERNQLFEALLHNANDKDCEVRKVAVNALGYYAQQSAHYSLVECGQLLDALRLAMSDKEYGVRYAAAWALNIYVKKTAYYSSKDFRLLDVLRLAADDEERQVCEKAVEALEIYVKRSVHLSSGPERERLLDVVLHYMSNKDWKVRQAAVGILGICAHQATYSLAKRGRLLDALLLAAGDEEYWVRKRAVETIGVCAQQSTHYSSAEHTRLIDALWRASNDTGYVRDEAVKALKIFYEQQIAHYSSTERSQLLERLLTASDKNDWQRDAAALVLKIYVQQSTHYSLTERSQLLEMLLLSAGDKNEWVRSAAVGALEVYVQQVTHYSSAEHSRLLEVLLTAICDKNWWVQEIAAEALKIYLLWDKHYSSTKRILSLEMLLLAGGHEDCNVHWKAAEAVRVYVQRAEQFSSVEHSKLLTTLLGAVGDKKNWQVQCLAIKALGVYVEQSVYYPSTMRSQLLEMLLLAAGDKSGSIRYAAVETLGICAQQRTHYSSAERNQLFDALLHNASDKNKDVRCQAVRMLGIYAQRGAHSSSTERDRLLRVLRLAATAGDENQWVVNAAVEILGVCAQQIEHYSSVERGLILDTLLVVGEKKGYVRCQAIKALGNCVPHAAHCSLAERGRLLDTLRLAAGYGTDPVRETAVKILVVCVQHVKQFSPAEHNELFTALLLAESNQSSHYREDIWAHALKIYVQNLVNYSSAERSRLFDALLLAAEDQNDKVRQEAIVLLNKLTVTYQEWLSLDYQKTYPVLQALLKGGRLLSNIPIQGLLTAYLTDQAKRVLNIYPRRSLWLQFLIKRILLEGAALCLQDEHLILYSSHTRQPFRIALPKANRETLMRNLRNALVKQANFTKLPLPNAQRMTLPPEEKPISLSSSQYELPDLDRINKQVKKQGEKLQKHDEKLEVHHQRLDKLESEVNKLNAEITQLKTDVDRHEVKLTTYKKMHESLYACVGELDKIFSDKLAATKKEIDELKDDEKTIAKKYETFLESCLTSLDQFEKQEQKNGVRFEAHYQQLQTEQQKLTESFKSFSKKIIALETTDTSKSSEIARLLALTPTIEKIKTEFEKQQARLQTREQLFQDPKIAEFYRIMHTRLTGFYLVCTIAATGLVKIESNASLKEKATKFLVGTLGDNIPIPGAKAAASFINAMIEWHRMHREEQGRERAIEYDADNLSFADKEIAIELAIQETIRRYIQQIKAVKQSDIATLAICAINRIAHGVQEKPDDIKTTTTPPIQCDFPTQLVNHLHQVKEFKQGTFGHKDIATEDGSSKWNEDGIFRRTGIHNSSGEDLYFYTDETEKAGLFQGKLSSTEKPKCRYKKYGFRTISDEKQARAIAEAQGFNKPPSPSHTLPPGSWKLPPSPLLRKPPAREPTSGVLTGRAAMFQKSKKVAEDVQEAAVATAQDQLTTTASDMTTKVLGVGLSGSLS